MKKLLRTLLAAVIIASLLCVSLAAFAESDSASETASFEDTAVADTEDISEDEPIGISSVEDIPEKLDYAPDLGVEDAITTGAEAEATEEEESPFGYSFTLISKIAKVFDGEHTTDLIMLIAAVAVLVCLIVLLVILGRKSSKGTSFTGIKAKPVKILVYGALTLSISFVLSYIKFFSLPNGGSITLCSMLPIMVYAAWVGPKYGFIVSLCYAGLQIIQGAYAIHPVQFILDYILAFTALGLTSLFRKEKILPIGILVAGFARMLCSAGAGLFWGVPEGVKMNLFVYVLIYNFLTVGIDTIICLIVYLIPPVRKMFGRLREGAFGKISA